VEPEPEPEPKTQEPQSFDLMEPEPECIPVPVSERIWIRIQHTMEYQSLKYQKGEANFLGNNAASNIEKARFCTFVLLKNCARYCLEPEPAPEQEPKIFQCWNRNKNRNGKRSLRPSVIFKDGKTSMKSISHVPYT